MNLASVILSILTAIVGFALSIVTAIVNAILSAWQHIDPGAANTDAAMAFWSHCSDYVDVSILSTVIHVALSILAFGFFVKFVMWLSKFIPFA